MRERGCYPPQRLTMAQEVRTSAVMPPRMRAVNLDCPIRSCSLWGLVQHPRPAARDLRQYLLRLLARSDLGKFGRRCRKRPVFRSVCPRRQWNQKASAPRLQHEPRLIDTPKPEPPHHTASSSLQTVLLAAITNPTRPLLSRRPAAPEGYVPGGFRNHSGDCHQCFWIAILQLCTLSQTRPPQSLIGHLPSEAIRRRDRELKT
jgi:hypothetical protein